MGKSLFAPSNMSEGGGLIDDVVAVFSNVRLTVFDYEGKGSSSFGVMVDLEIEGGEPVNQFWSLGKAADWKSDDGLVPIALGRQTQLNVKSNGGILITSIVNAGFPEDKITDSVAFMEGMKAHLIRVPAPERKGLVKTPRADGKVYESTILTVDQILQLPWEKKGKAATKSATAKGASQKGGEAPPNVDEEAVNAVISLLAESEGEAIAKSKLPGMVFKKVATSPNKSAILAKVMTDEFLSSHDEWVYENGKVSMG